MTNAKQIAAVLEAVNAGAATSEDVAFDTGLSKKAASSYLTQLCDDGEIQRVEEMSMPSLSGRGRRFNVYGPTDVLPSFHPREREHVS